MPMNPDDHREKRNEYLPYARQMLQYFVGNFHHIYGSLFNVYNVHSLLHLSDDVEHFQLSLNEMSSFPNENKLRLINKLVKNGRNPIAQVTKRLIDSESAGGI